MLFQDDFLKFKSRNLSDVDWEILEGLEEVLFVS